MKNSVALTTRPFRYTQLLKAIQTELTQARQKIAHAQAAAYWKIGRYISQHLLENKERAGYGERVYERLSQDLNIGAKTLERAVRFSREFPIPTTSSKLHWSHYYTLLAIPDESRRKEVLRKTIHQHLSIRQLRKEISQKHLSRERAQPTPSAVKLSLTRGRLYAYRIDTTDGVPVIDCGFAVYLEGVLSPKAHFTDNTIIESRKILDGYSFKTSNAKKNELYTYKAVVRKIIDGDTLWVTINAGFGIRLRQKLRLRAIDAPELTTPRGQKAKAFVEKVLKDLSFVIIKTYKPDKFDRYLADVFFLEDEDDAAAVAEEGKFLNQQLLDEGLAKLWSEG